MESLESEKDKFLKELRDLTEEFLIVQKFDDFGKVNECAKEVFTLKDRLQKATDKVTSFNERELLFKQPQSDYEELNILKKDFSSYDKLWNSAVEFEADKSDWNTGSFLKLNFTEIDLKVR